MVKKVLLGLAVCFFLAGTVQAEERYSISGVATFKEGAVIFITALALLLAFSQGEKSL